MKNNRCIFTAMKNKHLMLFAFCATIFSFVLVDTNAATVVSRTKRPSIAQRTSTQMATASNAQPVTPTQTVANATDDDTLSENIILDKSSQFSEFMSDNTVDSSQSNTLADQIRAQRAALDSADALSTADRQMAMATATGSNACDTNLRACMQEKCGKDYSKCAGDTDTSWGNKMDACRRNLPCSGSEYAALAPEIKADRDMNARIASYNSIVECGNQYNNCIVTECGQNFTKCLGKKAGDTAISKCNKIAQNCKKQDSGLASRAMNVFATLRVDAEKQIAADEKRLYALRDSMGAACKRLGAMFDERTLDCVYTVNFYAGEDNTLYASKKAYAGSSFSCTPNWFGIDITTFMENAMRLTREQKSASAAMLGSGIGTATGAISSGAIDRAVDRHQAEKALKEAQGGGKKKALKTNNNSKKTETKEKMANTDTPQQKKQDKISTMLRQPKTNNIAYALNEETHYNNLYSGIGTEPSAISSDAIGRAVDQHKTEQPLKEAQGGGAKKATNTKNKSKETEKKGKKGNAEPVQNTSQPEDIPYELRQLLAM